MMFAPKGLDSTYLHSQVSQKL